MIPPGRLGEMPVSDATPWLHVFAPAKINWVLTIRGRRADGFHDLDTVFQTLNWGDDLFLRRRRSARCRIWCDQPGIPLGDDNLIARAWRLMRETYPGRVGGVEVRLVKRIPAGAGLGGGSADAAAALRGIDRLYALGLAPDRLEALAAQLGSDCAFFVRGGTALATGRGDRLQPLVSRLPRLSLVLVWPGFGSSTVEAYRRVRPSQYCDARRTRAVAKAIEAGQVQQLQKLIHNVFSGLVSESDMRYKGLNDNILIERLVRPTMTGSGSAMFAFANDRLHARRAAQRLKRIYPLAHVVEPRRIGVRAMGMRSNPCEERRCVPSRK
jgi:4-diphosphocytidyl-2-C-methyl-D-erythritol kinase